MMDRFVSAIKQKYRERRLNREKQWPICKADRLVKLVIVENEQGRGRYDTQQSDHECKKAPLAYADLFKAEQNRKKPVLR